MEVAARFQSVAEPRPSNFYSIEQVMVGITDTGIGAALNIRLAVENMDEVPASGSTGARFENYRIFVDSSNNFPLGAAMLLERNATKLAYFIGAPIKNALNAQVAIDTVNQSGVSLSVKLQGYYWEAGAINAIGGLQRPVTGLYG